jgi:hypothetical protein
MLKRNWDGLARRVAEYGSSSFPGIGIAFEFRANRNGPFVGAQKDDPNRERNLGPVCEVWIEDYDIARISQDDARIIISEISEGLLESFLLANIPRTECVGPKLSRVIFAHAPFQEMNLELR